MIEVAVELPHWEVELAADLADGFLDDFGISLFVVGAMPLDELAHLAKELFLLLNELNTVAGLMEASVAGIAVQHLILIVAFGAEADLAVSFEETLQLLDFSVALLPEFLFHVQLFDHCYLQSILQHLLCLVGMPSLEIQQHFSHPQLFFYLRDFLLNMRELTLWSAHAAQHLIPVGLVALIGTIQLKSPQFHFFIDLVLVLQADHIVVQ